MPFFVTHSVPFLEQSTVDLDRDDLLAALEASDWLNKLFSMLNPRASLAEVALRPRGTASGSLYPWLHVLLFGLQSRYLAL